MPCFLEVGGRCRSESLIQIEQGVRSCDVEASNCIARLSAGLAARLQPCTESRHLLELLRKRQMGCIKIGAVRKCWIRVPHQLLTRRLIDLLRRHPRSKRLPKGVKVDEAPPWNLVGNLRVCEVGAHYLHTRNGSEDERLRLAGVGWCGFEQGRLSLPRFRGHQIWRGCSPGGLHGQDAQDIEEAATPLVHP